MKIFLLISVLLSVVSLSAPLSAEELSIQPSIGHPVESLFTWVKENNTAFNSGEKFTFNICWQFITVGSANMEIDGIHDINGRKAYHIISKADSAPFFDNFFKVRDINESWMDVDSLSSLKFSSHISEGGYKKDETILIDQEKRKFIISESGKTGDTPQWVRDVLSSMYYLRTRELNVGKEYSIDAHSGDKSWPLKVKVIGKERVNTPAGKFECWVIEPALREDSGIFKSSGKLTIWLTCDARKMPVLMRSKIAVGHIEARLQDFR